MKKIFALVLVFAMTMGGCSLAVEDTRKTAGTDYEDRLIGAFLTREYLDLFDSDSYLQENPQKILEGGLIDGDTADYQSRLYAESDSAAAVYPFPELDGYAMFCPVTIRDGIRCFGNITSPAVSDLGMNLTDTDETEGIDLRGTLYLSEDIGRVTYYLNPVYQDEDGNVYLIAGDGISFYTQEGVSSALSVDDEVTIRENDKQRTYRGSVTVTLEVVPHTKEIHVLQMDADSNLLSRDRYPVGKVPQELTPLPETAYLVVEIHGLQAVSRTIYEKSAKDFQTFAPPQNGVCETRSTAILWSE